MAIRSSASTRVASHLRALAALCVAAVLPPAQAANGVIAGRVVDQAQHGVAGVFVTARDVATHVETTVYTGTDGRYALPPLASARYEVRAHHARFDDATREIALADSGATVELALTPAADPLRLAPSAAWFAHVPDGPEKREFILNCASCHEIAQGRLYKDGAVRDKAKWLAAFGLMKSFDKYAVIPPDFDFAKYSDWLTTQFNTETVATIAPPALAPAATQAAKAVITEYPVPLANELPHDLVVGPDKRIWVTAFWNSLIWALDPASGKVESFEVNDQPHVAAQVRALEFAQDGTLWLVNGGTESVVHLDTHTKKYTTYKVGLYPHDLALDSHGDIWLNDYFGKKEGIARVSAKDGTVTRFPLPSANLPESAGVPLPYGMQIDKQDRLWSAQLAANTLARYDIATGQAKLYPMPGDNVGPRRMAVGPDGKIWIAEFNTGRVTSFDPKGEKFESFDTGVSAAGIYDVEVDQRTGDVWLAAALASELILLDAKTHAFTHFPMPTEPAYMRHLAVDPVNGDVWSAYSSLPTAVPKVVRLHRGP